MRTTIQAITLGTCLLLATDANAQDWDPRIKWTCEPNAGKFSMVFISPNEISLGADTGYLIAKDDFRKTCRLKGAGWAVAMGRLDRRTGPCAADPELVVTVTRNGQRILDRVFVDLTCWDSPTVKSIAVAEPGAGQGPMIELCASPKLGKQPKCQSLNVRRTTLPINNDRMPKYAGIE